MIGIAPKIGTVVLIERPVRWTELGSMMGLRPRVGLGGALSVWCPKKVSRVCGASLMAVMLVGCAGLDPAAIDMVLSGSGSSGQRPLDERTVADGLREALRVGVGRAIDRVSVVDGYLANELIRIHLPEELQDMAELLRRIGFSRQVDALEVAMNRAAEQAAGEAREVFVDTIVDMSIADAFGILRGGETAATDYLHGRTSNHLRARFRPIIEQRMEKLELYRAYDQLAGTYNALPFTKRPAVSLDTYLTDRSLHGLFAILADEERKIRRDPVARTTELLRRVFRPNALTEMP